MKLPHATQEFKRLTAFKSYIEDTIKPYCETTYGRSLYNKVIVQHLNDLLENLAFDLEVAAEKSIHEEELSYDGGLTNGTE